MKSTSQNLPTARAEKRRVFQDLAGEEEDVGLACPPFDEEGFMAAEASYFDLSEEGFFGRVHEDHHKSAERVQGSPGNLSAILIKKTRHGKGKDMKVLEDQQVSKRKNNACKDTNTTPEAKILIEPKKTLAKAAIGDGVLSFEEKITLAKRKLHERYDQVAKEKRRKQIQVLSLSELPKFPQEKCRPRSGFTPKFKSCAGSH
ncbi:glutamic acid-rich protein [Salix suchowensis]|nr:glutamic acid-rich protein [Salix suchowensis]